MWTATWTPKKCWSIATKQAQGQITATGFFLQLNWFWLSTSALDKATQFDNRPALFVYSQFDNVIHHLGLCLSLGFTRNWSACSHLIGGKNISCNHACDFCSCIFEILHHRWWIFECYSIGKCIDVVLMSGSHFLIDQSKSKNNMLTTRLQTSEQLYVNAFHHSRRCFFALPCLLLIPE